MNIICVTYLPIEWGGFYAVSRVGRVPPESCLYPKFRMSFAELVSRSRLVPQSQVCQRSARVFLTTAPHPEQSCDVIDGFTKRTVRPALAALATTIPVNVLH